MSNHLESQFVTSLQVAEQAFEHWRHTRTRRSPTPEVLRLQAVSLIGEHRREHICTALRINDQALKQWERRMTEPGNAQCMEHQSGESAQTKKAFIELPVHMPAAHDVVAGKMPVTAMHIDLPNGTVIRTDPLFSLEQIVSAVCTSLEPGE